MAGGPVHRGRGPSLGVLDHNRGGDPPRLGLPGHHPGLPPSRGHAPAGPLPPPPRQGHRPTAPGGAPLPQAASGHRGSALLPSGAHSGGPGTPLGRPLLAGATSAGRGRTAPQGAVGLGGTLTSPGQAPRARPRVCDPGAQWLTRRASPAGITPPPPRDAGGKGLGHAPGGGQEPPQRVARLARGGLVF